MLFLILLAVGVVVGISICFIGGEFGSLFPLGLLITVISGLLLLISLLLFPINHYETMENIAEFKATSETLKNARQNGNVLENAALQQKVVECNAWLGGVKYYRTTIWKMWIPQEVMALEPIK